MQQTSLRTFRSVLYCRTVGHEAILTLRTTCIALVTADDGKTLTMPFRMRTSDSPCRMQRVRLYGADCNQSALVVSFRSLTLLLTNSTSSRTRTKNAVVAFSSLFTFILNILNLFLQCAARSYSADEGGHAGVAWKLRHPRGLDAIRTPKASHQGGIGGIWHRPRWRHHCRKRVHAQVRTLCSRKGILLMVF